MANIQERRDKTGKLVSYSIRVHRGRGADGRQLKPWTATFDVAPTWTEKSARKKAEAFAATFEKECKSGLASDTRLRFDEYCDYVIDLKEKRDALKHSTVVRYRELTSRIYPAIGHIKLRDLRADHLNDLYTALGENGTRITTPKAKARVDLAAMLKEKGITRTAIAESSGMGASTINAAIRGETVGKAAAVAVCDALGCKLEKAFLTMEKMEPLSAKTILEHHRLIHTVLEQAVKEGLVPFNVASRATLPKASQKKANYFSETTVVAIRDALEEEPAKWKMLVHLYMITGARRGEILGLKWAAVDFAHNRIRIENNILYSVDRGIYEDTPKTESSVRWVTLPAETMALLKEWRAYQAGEQLRLGEYYQDQGFVFARDNGQPMHPDSVTDWMKKFAQRHDLPHINPHAFRHTMASLLFFNNVDCVSISKRLGHAKVSTTEDIYAHIIEEADQRNAEILSDVFLKRA